MYCIVAYNQHVLLYGSLPLQATLWSMAEFTASCLGHLDLLISVLCSAVPYSRALISDQTVEVSRTTA